MQQVREKPARPSLAAIGLRLSDWFERWFPDAFALALVAAGIVFAASAAVSGSLVRSAQWFGAGFWDLIAFTMQMALIIVTGYAVATAPPVYAVIRQYPIYAGIVWMMTESGLADRMAEFFVAISNFHTFPVLVKIYSAFLGLFVPSAGGKWLIEAPYVLDAAISLDVHLGWVVQTYNATEALANLIHPFWMLPLIGILGLKARDIIGYSTLQFVVHVPVVLFLVWILNYTL